MFPPEWNSIQIDWELLLSSLVPSFFSQSQSSSRISAADLQLWPPCTALTGALLNLKADKRACTCRRRLMPLSLQSLECLPQTSFHRRWPGVRAGVWVVQAQRSHLQLFAVLHLCVSHVHTHLQLAPPLLPALRQSFSTCSQSQV